MFGNSILDALATFGYVAGFLGIGGCIIVYFAAPKMIKLILNNEDNNEERGNGHDIK